MYDGQTNNKSMNFIEPIKIFLKYGADINKIDPHMNKYYYTTIFTEIVKQMIIHIQSQEYRDEENSDEEVFNLLKLFVYTGIDENLGNPSFNDYIYYYYVVILIIIILLSSKRNMDLVQKCTKLADAIPMLEVRFKVAFKI